MGRLKAEKATQSQCWCGRWWVIQDFIDMCAAGQHLATPSERT